MGTHNKDSIVTALIQQNNMLLNQNILVLSQLLESENTAFAEEAKMLLHKAINDH